MRRREFITVLGGAAVWPVLVHAQQPDRMRRVGVLLAFPEQNSLSQAIISAFAGALGHFGWVA